MSEGGKQRAKIKRERTKARDTHLPRITLPSPVNHRSSLYWQVTGAARARLFIRRPAKRRRKKRRGKGNRARVTTPGAAPFLLDVARRDVT